MCNEKIPLRFVMSSLLPTLVTLRTVGERWGTKRALCKMQLRSTREFSIRQPPNQHQQRSIVFYTQLELREATRSQTRLSNALFLTANADEPVPVIGSRFQAHNPRTLGSLASQQPERMRSRNPRGNLRRNWSLSHPRSVLQA